MGRKKSQNDCGKETGAQFGPKPSQNGLNLLPFHLIIYHFGDQQYTLQTSIYTYTKFNFLTFLNNFKGSQNTINIWYRIFRELFVVNVSIYHYRYFIILLCLMKVNNSKYIGYKNLCNLTLC